MFLPQANNQQLLAVSRWILPSECEWNNTKKAALFRESSAEGNRQFFNVWCEAQRSQVCQKFIKNDMNIMCSGETIREWVRARVCEMLFFFVYIFKNVFIIYTQRKDHFVCAQFAHSKGKSPVSFRADRIADWSKIHIYFLSLKPFPGKITFHGLKKKRWYSPLGMVRFALWSDFPFCLHNFCPFGFTSLRVNVDL